MSSDYIAHHGILGMKWGVRRYRNADGTLTEAGKKRYYKTDERGISRLTKAGYSYNKKQEDKIYRFTNSAFANLKKTNKSFANTYKRYSELEKKRVQEYGKHSSDWANGKGKYKGVDYYKFSKLAADDWSGSNAGKSQAALKKQIKGMVEEAVREHPLYNKTYSELNTNHASLETIKYGEEATRRIMQTIQYDAYAEARGANGKEKK